MPRPILLIVLSQDEVDPSDLEQVQAAAPGYEVVVTNDGGEITRLAPRVEIVTGRIDTAHFKTMPNLRWYQQWGAGADWLLRDPEAQAAPYIVTSASGIHAIQISEHIFALLLAFARRLPQAFAHQQQRAWISPDWDEVFELANKTLLLLGVGAIGARTALLAHAHDMRVIGVRRDPEETVEGIDEMVGPDDLHSVLPRADFIVVTLPLTTETRHLIGAQEFDQMKSNAILINIGRGGNIDEDALIRALDQGQIAGAGLDVTDPEPLPADSPLWGMDNVIITAHYAGKTPHYNGRAFAVFLDNLARFVADEPMINLVDKQLGY